MKMSYPTYPEPRNFSICAIRVYEECAHRKIIHEGLYFLNDLLEECQDGGVRISDSSRVPSDFYGNNISIQAIVGENGSGKSSLLELMYRLINNFSFMLELGIHKNSSAMGLCYVQGLKLRLYFLIDGKLGELYSWDDYMTFSYADYNQELSFHRITNARIRPDNNDSLDIEEEAVVQATVTAPVARMAEVARRFFYTIVTNYSVQSCIDNDFAEEKTLIEYHPQLEEGKTGKKQVTRDVVERDEGDVWIQKVFHKKDGYRTPIVLNPTRDSGSIYMNREYRLTTYRLSSVFLRARQLNVELLDDYRFSDISYTFDRHAIELRYQRLFDRQVDHNKEWIAFLDIENELLSRPKTIACCILQFWNITKRKDLGDPIIRDSCLYIIYKTLAIASKYPSYYMFESFGKIQSYFQEIDETYTEEKLSRLLDTIKKDKSHITMKYRQMLNFLELTERNPHFVKNNSKGFRYEEYIDSLIQYGVVKERPHLMQDIQEDLPPALFNIDILMEEKTTNKAVQIRRMSSGERQFLYTCSTFVYHLLNLKSVQDSKSVRYRCMNLILDEVEICFHPEYQRCFISKLLNLLTKLKLNYRCSLNIIISTHSPFILSDIPQQNILYLENGKCVNETVAVNPYAANVNDILHQSFFLKDSFMGEFALTRMKQLIKDIDGLGRRKGLRKKDELLQEINLIGDKFLKQQLTTYLNFHLKVNEYGKDTD